MTGRLLWWCSSSKGSPRSRMPLLVQELAEKVFAKQMQNAHALADERKKKNYIEFWNIIPIQDPFRLVLSELRDRLYHTREILHHALVHPS